MAKFKCELCKTRVAKHQWFNREGKELYICNKCFDRVSVDVFGEILQKIRKLESTIDYEKNPVENTVHAFGRLLAVRLITLRYMPDVNPAPKRITYVESWRKYTGDEDDSGELWKSNFGKKSNPYLSVVVDYDEWERTIRLSRKFTRKGMPKIFEQKEWIVDLRTWFNPHVLYRYSDVEEEGHEWYDDDIGIERLKHAVASYDLLLNNKSKLTFDEEDGADNDE